MGYTKTEFQPKDTLPANVVNAMQDAIIKNENNSDTIVAQLALMKYMLWTANINSTLNNLVIGIGIDNEIGTGRVLAMYGGDMNAMYGTSETLPTLVKIDTLDEINEQCVIEMFDNASLKALILGRSDFMTSMYYGFAKRRITASDSVSLTMVEGTSSSYKVTRSGDAIQILMKPANANSSWTLKTNAFDTKGAKYIDFGASVVSNAEYWDNTLKIFDASTDEEIASFWISKGHGGGGIEVITSANMRVDISGHDSIYFATTSGPYYYVDTTTYQGIILSNIVFANYGRYDVTKGWDSSGKEI